MSEQDVPTQTPPPKNEPRHHGCAMFLHDFMAGSQGKEHSRALTERQLAEELQRNRQLRELFQEDSLERQLKAFRARR
jgi:hypothetical protein